MFKYQHKTRVIDHLIRESLPRKEDLRAQLKDLN